MSEECQTCFDNESMTTLGKPVVFGCVGRRRQMSNAIRSKICNKFFIFTTIVFKLRKDYSKFSKALSLGKIIAVSDLFLIGYSHT